MRCMAHIVNLVVMDGLKDVGVSMLKVEFNLLDVEYSSKYKRAFERYESQEPMFRLELGENGVPDFHDWSECKKMVEMLSHFYELTLRISGSWSSLTPRIVEALICGQDWIRSLNCPINVEENVEELEKLEEVLSSVSVTQLGGSSCSTPTLNS
ncbi:hypothetical protein GH714_008978 [Hevea brasiliensis]|uniref:HAT C-terminal dimerisation domain-containing protein n=1 Tax=Hevea brasiliensis TaxID=3981 RepID=A0A6A6KKZ6_HEVBR|nr:hypothetical protein GH714_008978 [Hevea brasiliensis]